MRDLLYRGVIFKWVLIIASIFILTGCFFSKKHRALRKIEKAKVLYPDFFKNDTIIVYDTIVIEQNKYDTISKIFYNDSIIVINNDKVFLKYFYDTLKKEIYHEVICKSDTVIVENKIIKEGFTSNFYIERKFKQYKDYLFLLFYLILIIILFFRKK